MHFVILATAARPTNTLPATASHSVACDIILLYAIGALCRERVVWDWAVVDNALTLTAHWLEGTQDPAAGANPASHPGPRHARVAAASELKQLPSAADT